MKKRILSMLLVVVMVASMFPASIFHAHADTVTKKPFYLVNYSEITGDAATSLEKNSFQLIRTNTNSVSAGAMPQVFLLGQTDPAAGAQALWAYFEENEYPEGSRYFELDLLGAALKNLAENNVYYDEGVAVVRMWLETFLTAYSAIDGAKLDGIVTDWEYHGSHGYKGYLGNGYDAADPATDIVAKIAANEKFPVLKAKLLENGFVWNDTYSKEDNLATAFSWYATDKVTKENTTNSSAWNQTMDAMERDAINEAVLDVLLKYYPDAIVSDYQSASQRAYNETLVWNGKPEFYKNIYPAGNATNMNAYSGRVNGVTTAPSEYIGEWDSDNYESAFYSALFEAKFAKDALAVSQDIYGIDKQHIWVGGYSYGHVNDNSGNEFWGSSFESSNAVYSGSYSETVYYAEAMFHLGLATDEPFIGYIVANEEDGRLGYGGVGYNACIEIFDDILKELTKVAGYSDRTPIRYPSDWNDKYILSGMYAGGRNIWRLTPEMAQLIAEGKTLETFQINAADPTFKIDGLTISFPQGSIITTGEINGKKSDGTPVTAGSCGYWIETPANVQPVIVADENRFETGRFADKVAANAITTNYKLYETVLGNAFETNSTTGTTVESASFIGDMDYRINWVNATEINYKATVYCGDKVVATFLAPKGQDGIATGSYHNHSGSNVALRVVYSEVSPEDVPAGTIDPDYVNKSIASVTLAGTEITIAKEDAANYYIVTDGAVTDAGATEENYNFKVDFVDDVATLYVKDVNLTTADSISALKIGKDGCQNFDLNIVVETDSVLSSDLGATIDAWGMIGTVTISGTGALTVNSGASHAIRSTAKLVLQGAKLNASAAGTNENNEGYNYAAIWVKGAAVVMNSSTVNLTAEDGACLWIGEINGVSGKYSITIKNSTVSATSNKTDKPTIGCGGKIYVDNSNVDIYSETGKPVASSAPVITNAHAHAGATENPTTAYDGASISDIVYFNVSTNLNKVDAKVPVCNKNNELIDGATERITCNICGDIIKESQTITAAHKFATRTENYVAATAEKQGSYDKVTYCVNCDYVDESQSQRGIAIETATSVEIAFYKESSGEEGSGSNVTLNHGDADKYYVTKVLPGTYANTVFTTAGADADNYDLKLSWPAGGYPTIYFNGFYYNHRRSPLTITANDVPVTIVVEENSTIFADYVNATYVAIAHTGTAPLTITSKGNAKLTVIDEATAAISTNTDLIFKNANIEVRGNTVYQGATNSYNGSIVALGDVTVDHSTLYVTSERTSYIAGCKNISVINGSSFTTDKIFYTGASSPNDVAFKFSGEFVISGSNVAFTQNYGTDYVGSGMKFFTSEPVLRGVVAKAGGWQGTFVSVDGTYGDHWTNKSYFATAYDPAKLSSYTYFETTVCGHKADPAAEAVRVKCQERAVCVDCGLTFGELDAHQYTITNCGENVNCTVCNALVHKAGDHEWVVDAAVPATCDEDGLTEGEHCSACGKVETYQEVIPATGHDEYVVEGTPATCTESGLTDGIKCNNINCGVWIKEQETIEAGHDGSTIVIDPGVAATCTQAGLSDGSHCSECYRVFNPQDVINPLGHVDNDSEDPKKTITTVTKEATCTNSGLYNVDVYCDREGCDYKYENLSSKDNVIEKLPHTLSHSVVDGQNVFTCSCGHTEESMTYDYVMYDENQAYIQFYTKNGITYRYINNNKPNYWCTVNNYISEKDAENNIANEYNYNIKAVFVDGKLTVYLRDAHLDYGTENNNGIVIGGCYNSKTDTPVTNFACDFIIESDSSIKTYGNTLLFYNTEGVKITSANDAKLTCTIPNYYSSSSALDAYSDVTLDNANVEFNVCTYDSQNVYVTGDLNIWNSKVKLNNNSNGSYAFYAIYLADKSAEDKSNLNIRNSQVVSTQARKAGTMPAFRFNGTFTIERSDVEILANAVAFSYHPTIVENTHSSIKKNNYAVDTAPSGQTNYTGYTPGAANTNVGYFRSVHTCGGKLVYEAPQIPCRAFMDAVTYCAVCGVEVSRDQTSEVEVNTAVAEHTPGEPVKETNDDGSYYMVTYCTACGVETGRSDLIVPPVYKYASIYLYDTYKTIKNDGVPSYYCTVNGAVSTNDENGTEANENNYNIKLVYDPETDMVCVYLKGAVITQSGYSRGIILGSTNGTSASNNDFACTVIVEENSAITSYYEDIVALNTRGLTIKSTNLKTLSLTNTNATQTLATACDTVIQNVVLNCTYPYQDVNIVVQGNLLIDGSIVTLTNTSSRCRRAIMLSESISGVVNTTGTPRNLTIRNSKLTSQTVYAYDPQLSFDGTLTIDRSDVTIKANDSLFSFAPTLSNHSSVLGGSKTWTYAAGTPDATIGYCPSFVSVHTCGGGEVEYVAPAIACSEYMDKLTHCAVPGCETTIRETSTEKANPDAAEHTPGNAIIENNVPATESTTGSYDNVVCCSECGTELSRETVTVPVVKKVTVKFGSTTITLTNDDVPAYYTVSSSGALTKLTGDTSGYNLKLRYNNDENRVYIYLNAFNASSMGSGTNGFIIGTADGADANNFACKIVIEANSTISNYVSSGALSNIYAYNTAGLEITSENGATLTINPRNYGMAIASMSNTVVRNASLDIKSGGYDVEGIFWVTGDLLIENSNVQMPSGAYTLQGSNILLSDSRSSLTGSGYDLTIRNSTLYAYANGGYNKGCLRMNGELYIDRSDVTIDGNMLAFYKAPHLSNISTATYGEHGPGSTNYLTSALNVPGTVLSDSSKVGGFASVHMCGGGEVEYVAPAIACSAYLDKLTHCAFDGCEKTVREVSTEFANETPAEHNFGEAEKVYIPEQAGDGYSIYKMVKTCTYCGHTDDDNGKAYKEYLTKTGYFKVGTTGITVTNNGEAKYYTVATSNSVSSATQITDPALYYTYNIKVVFPNADAEGNANNTVYVYLNNNLDLQYVSGYNVALTIGSATYNNFACHIVVESTSTIKGNGSGGTAGAINSLITGGLTITCKNDAVLNLIGANGSTLSSSACDLTLKNANIESSNTYATNIWVKGNLLIENTTLNLVATKSNMSRQVCLGSAYNTYGNYNLEIVNSIVTSNYLAGGSTPVWDFGGTFTIERSDVSISSNFYPFRMTPSYTGVNTPVYTEYSVGTSNNLSYEPGSDLLTAYVYTNQIARFATTHICLAGDPVQIAPEHACDEYMLDVTYCVVCDKVLSSEISATPNNEKVDHIPGEPEEVITAATAETNGSYYTVTKCTGCDKVLEQTDPVTIYKTKTGWVRIGTSGGSVTITNNGVAKYYTVSGATAEETDDTVHYNVKVVFPNADAEGNENYTVEVYLKGLTLETSSGSDGALKIGSTTYNDFACHIIVESASSITGHGAASDDAAGAIYACNTRGLTISSKNETAVLTLKDKNGCTFFSKSCDVTFQNANIVSLCWYYTNIRVNGNLLIDGSNLTLKHAYDQRSVQRHIVLGTKRDGWDGSTTYNISIKDSTVVSYAPQLSSQTVWEFGGKLDIERSDVTIEANAKAFTSYPNMVGDTHSAVKVKSFGYNTTIGETPAGASNYNATPYEKNTTIGYFRSVHDCGGVDNIVAYEMYDCRAFEIHLVSCGVYGCTSDPQEVKVEIFPDDLVPHDLVEDKSRREISLTPTPTAIITYVCTEGCGYEETVEKALDSTVFQYFNSSKSLKSVTMYEGMAPEYFTTVESSSVIYLEQTNDSANYKLKLTYEVGEEPTLYLNGLTMNNLAGIVFGGEISGIGEGDTIKTIGTSKLKIVIEAESTITNINVSGSGNYYQHPAINLLTSGTVTITSVNGAKLNLLDNNQLTTGSAAIQAYGDVVFDEANIYIAKGSAWGVLNAGIKILGGDLYVHGGMLDIYNANQNFGKYLYLRKDANQKGGNFIIDEAAHVVFRIPASDYTGSGPLVDIDGTLTIYSGADVLMGGVDRLFSTMPQFVGYSNTHYGTVVNGGTFTKDDATGRYTLSISGEKAYDESAYASMLYFRAVPGECPHTNKTHHEYVAPNCMREGMEEYWTCDACGAFLDANGDIILDNEGNPIKDTNTLKVPQDANSEHINGDNWKKLPNAIAPVIPATCEEDGSYWIANICTGCGEYEIERREVIVPKSSNGHAWVNTSVVEGTTTALGVITQVCTSCDATRTINTPAKFYGTNVNLGNSLKMNFYFYDRLRGVDYDGAYALIVKTNAYGQEEVERVNLTNDMINGTYYVISCEDIAAKEMCDVVKVTVYDANGTAISETKEETIKAYAVRLLENEKYEDDTNIKNRKLKTLLVDMLCYGAAMQNYFSYNTGNLATNGLTAEQLQYATQGVVNLDAEREVSGDAYKASSISTGSKISLNIYVDAAKIGAGGYITVTYMNFRTGENETSDHITGVQKGSNYLFAFEELSVAESTAELTIVAYTAEGDEVFTLTESMESYLLRFSNTSGTNVNHAQAIVKFANAANAYFTPTR